MILIVQAEWNASITDALAEAAKKTIEKAGYQTKLIKVPGAMEIPLAIKWAWSHGQNTHEYIEGAVALGCVIKGDTYHFELVANECSRALAALSLELKIPVGHGVLAVYELDQALQRSSNSHNKGVEAADAVIRMLALKSEIQDRSTRKEA